MKRYLAALFAMALLLSGCQGAWTPETSEQERINAVPKVYAVDMMEGIIPNPVEAEPAWENPAAMDFAVRLLQKTNGPKNTLISPLSVLTALSMTANGAAEETLSQMEAALGGQTDTLNSWIFHYLESLTQEESLALANAIWFRDDDRLTLEQSFLQTNADYYRAAIRKSPFNDTTVGEINGWVKENTDGMIDGILQEIPADAILYLVNALAFDAKWQEAYKQYQVQKGLFHLTDADGTSREAWMMHSAEQLYLEDGQATGFMKYYEGGRYAFVALLPREDVSLQSYIASLTGEHLSALLDSPQNVTVYAALPKFEVEYECEMTDVLRSMGMVDAFDHLRADFSGMGGSDQGNIVISRVLHKTFLSVDEAGTKAAAVTAAEITNEACEIIDYKTVTLDRPFLYMILDTETNTPIFMGTLLDIAQ